MRYFFFSASGLDSQGNLLFFSDVIERDSFPNRKHLLEIVKENGFVSQINILSISEFANEYDGKHFKD